MKKYRFISAFISLALVMALLCPVAMAVQPPQTQAEAVLLMDAANDEVLHEINADQRMFPASLTKVMTALLVLEAVDEGRLGLEQVITVSSTYSTGLTAGGSTQDIRAGEQMQVLDLLYCLLVPSANESANILAEAVDGSIEAFVTRMNDRAAELGCTGTHFVNPHGLHSPEHYTTARDLYRIARVAMENETFRTIVATKRYEVPATNMHEARVFYNTNALLVAWHYAGYTYDKTIGIKTGTTDEAGACLLSAAKDGERYLISVVLNAPVIPLGGGKNDRRQFTESRDLLKWGFANFSRRTLVDTVTPVEQVGVTLAEVDHVLVRPAQQLERTLPNDFDESKLLAVPQLYHKSVSAPVKEGQVLGKLVLNYDGEELGSVDLVAVNGVEQSKMQYFLAKVKGLFVPGEQSGVGYVVVRILLALLMIGLAAIVFCVVFLKPRRRRYGSRRYSGRRNYRGRRR